jgi:hypothetical protein
MRKLDLLQLTRNLLAATDPPMATPGDGSAPPIAQPDPAPSRARDAPGNVQLRGGPPRKVDPGPLRALRPRRRS